jgi:hypothetical protein
MAGLKAELGGLFGQLGPGLMDLFGKDTEERVNNLNSLATILQGVGKTMKGAESNTMEQRLMELLQARGQQVGGAGASMLPVATRSDFDPNTALRMLSSLGFGR